LKVVQINSVYGIGSTGAIAQNIGKVLSENGIENYVFYSGGIKTAEKRGIKYMSNFFVKCNAGLAKILGNYGFNTFFGTIKLIRKINKINPDIVQIHNIHGHNVNLSIFFKYLKKKNVEVIWTFHDCWAFTGYCPFFSKEDCNKWQTMCDKCPRASEFSFFSDKSKKQYLRKRKALTSVDKLLIITPSKWLAELVKKSYFKDYEVRVINNGIDLDIFKPTKSDYREKYGLQNKRIILSSPKGHTEPFKELNELIDKEKFAIVLLGVSKEEAKNLPDNILSLPKIRNKEEMAKWYTLADVFVNLSLEDNFPTVNIESLACGTPVVTYDTGGGPEIIDENTGITVPPRDVAAAWDAVKEVLKGESSEAKCIERARALYNAKDRFNDYYELYKEKGE